MDAELQMWWRGDTVQPVFLDKGSGWFKPVLFSNLAYFLQDTADWDFVSMYQDQNMVRKSADTVVKCKSTSLYEKVSRMINALDNR